MASLLFSQLEEIVEGDPQKRTAAAIIVRALIREAVKGDIRAIREIMDRVDGKPLTHIEVGGGQIDLSIRDDAAERFTSAITRLAAREKKS